jgi:hypothetical protein
LWNYWLKHLKKKRKMIPWTNTSLNNYIYQILRINLRSPIWKNKWIVLATGLVVSFGIIWKGYTWSFDNTLLKQFKQVLLVPFTAAFKTHVQHHSYLSISQWKCVFLLSQSLSTLTHCSLKRLVGSVTGVFMPIQ